MGYISQASPAQQGKPATLKGLSSCDKPFLSLKFEVKSNLSVSFTDSSPMRRAGRRPSDSVVHGIQADRLIRTAPTKSPQSDHFYESRVIQGDLVPLRLCRATAPTSYEPRATSHDSQSSVQGFEQAFAFFVGLAVGGGIVFVRNVGGLDFQLALEGLFEVRDIACGVGGDDAVGRDGTAGDFQGHDFRIQHVGLIWFHSSSRLPPSVMVSWVRSMPALR